MALLGFTTMKEKVQNGTKTQTIRKLRKHPIAAGDRLHLYWHLRQKDCEKLGEALCTETFFIRLMIFNVSLGKCAVELCDKKGPLNTFLSDQEIRDLALRDCFDTVGAMLTFLFKTHKHYSGSYQVIRWKCLSGGDTQLPIRDRWGRIGKVKV